ncbi:SGNH/GDSL hydrolase family protein [Azospirillum sp.]|uniref:SGNH/GDSL hydrolase family protein n=1 Tax=Azospirillum sp. TaxID=34012 RepID=UPI003D74618B
MTRRLAVLVSAALLLSSPTHAAPPSCPASAQLAALSAPLPHVAESLATGDPLRIVAIGSSSTAGAGASDAEHSYPARLSHYLHQIFPRADVTVLNKGANGEVGTDMLARFQRDVIDQKPDLVVWQVAANSVLRNLDPAGAERIIRDGVRRLKAAGLDVVLMDLQYSPAMLEKPVHTDMQARIARVAAEEGVGLFRRFALMRGWVLASNAAIPDLVGPDGIHHNDFGYDCIARALAGSIQEAAGLGSIQKAASLGPIGHAALHRP